MPTFRKIERLCSKKSIELLFAHGRHKTVMPLKLIYREASSDSPYPAKAMFVVPKKKFRRANQRNVLKRRMREAYRLHKESLYSAMQNGKQVEMAFIYLHHEAQDYARIDKSIGQLLTFLIQQNGMSGVVNPPE